MLTRSLVVAMGPLMLFGGGGCYVTPEIIPQPVIGFSAGPVSTSVPVPMSSAGPPPGGLIEAGCSYNGTQLQGPIGGVFQVACPPGCQSGGLWGSDVYTADSGICMAGIHAGAISPAGGVVTVRLEPGRPAYRGSIRNSLTSGDYGSYGKSYIFLGPQGQPFQAPVASGPAPMAAQPIEAGCSFNATQIRDAPGTAHLVSCPPNCARNGGLWGTDTYTGDSGICRAAIHAGLLGNQGGMVVVILDVGRPAFRGSTRNGEQSSDYGNYGSSFHLQAP